MNVSDKEISLATAYYRDSWPGAEWRRNKKEQKRRNLGDCDEACDADSVLLIHWLYAVRSLIIFSETNYSWSRLTDFMNGEW